ncbi:hypothetical protein JK386_17960 [Nocardioides sp. zg-536]|uniref:Uncharacterized protein n=1 Tax=Nocardioides faecalis TaxID=2803858 RepID=A0A938YD27_9ACTN|nr:hypothetical protein [Nocardioides faecalis]MBM9461781.1 hypothetical protein [Nocardioides faecalis]QVI57817.1 hypothetical protein KG111_12190 [Nocardioides faecalis]
MAAELERINPPVLYAHWWWAAAVVCLAGSVLVALVVRRALRQTAPAGGVDVDALRAAATGRIEALLADAATLRDDVERRRAAAQISGEVRAFLGTVTATDLDFTTRADWLRAAERDPRLAPAVEVLVELADMVFQAEGRSPSAAHVADGGTRALAVVNRWP